MPRRQPKPRVRISKASIRFRYQFAICLIALGVFIAIVLRHERKAVQVGLTLALGGLIALPFIRMQAKDPSHPLLSGYELEDKDAPPSPPEPTPADQLRDLTALRDDGIITEEEYEAKKNEIMARPW